MFENSQGVGWTVSVSYNAGLKRYILCTEHEQSFKGNLGIYDAPEPWGPWTTVAQYHDWGKFGSTFLLELLQQVAKPQRARLCADLHGHRAQRCLEHREGPIRSEITSPSRTGCDMPTPCKTTGIGFLVALGLLLTPITATIRAQEPDRVFPGTAWATKTPEELGLDRKKLQAFAANVKGVGCVVKDGYMVYSWGDQTLTRQNANTAILR